MCSEFRDFGCPRISFGAFSWYIAELTPPARIFSQSFYPFPDSLSYQSIQFELRSELIERFFFFEKVSILSLNLIQ